jgi:hypothetical protein
VAKTSAADVSRLQQLVGLAGGSNVS